MKKRLLAIILTVALVLCNIPLLSLGASGASTNEQQIEYVGGWNNENPLPENKGENSQPYETTGKLYNDRIAVSKTVAETDVENYFDITLKIVAKQRVIDQSVDVVLVLDNSNTMNATHQNLYPGAAGYNVEDSRIAHGKKAVSQFIDKFAAEENISQDRRLGVVTFNSYANTVVPLTTLNTTEQATSFKTSLNNITAPKGDRERFTNIEGGLQLAHNLLKESDAVYKYIIFVTDGFPTTYIESGRESTTQIVGWDTFEKDPYTAANLEKDGFFADAVTGKRCTSGVDYSDKAADRADDVAEVIKNDGINIFSIGIDVGVQTIADYVNTFANYSLSTVDRRSTNHVIGDTKASYQQWLSHSIAGGILIDNKNADETIHRYAEGNSQEQLETAFNNILKDIELLPSETMQEAYTIDPMSDYVEFLNFYNDYVDGGKVDKIVHTTRGTDVAVYDEETRQIKWWLAQTQSWNYDEKTGNYELYIRYRVRLKNEAEGFIPSTAFPTNDETTFYFKTISLEDGTPLYGDNEIDYRIPEVEGYLGKLEFTKVDSITGAPLQGAEFELHHDVDSCDICHAGGADHEDRPVINAKTATSDANGKVVFENLPSGHEYVLTELKAPAGYQPGTSHTVMVEYGKTSLHGKEINEENPGIVENDKIVHAEAVLTAKKSMTGRDFEEGEFTFTLDGVRMNGLEYHERHHIDANGEVTFEKIIFDREGTFTFKVAELKGDDKTVIYDDTVYTVTFDVKLNDAGTAYELTTKVDGQDIENDSNPDAFVFSNSLREKGKVQLRATKYMDDAAPADGAFTFELAAEDGTTLQTKSNVGTDIIFDEIEYDQEGVYTYQIAEVHVDNEDIFCDHSVYSATVTVTAPEDNGAFETSVEYALVGTRARANEAVFYNYTRKAGKLHISATKTLDGNIPDDQQFTFELRDENNDLVQTVKNDANGDIIFDTLEFSDVGVSHFTIHEVEDADEDIIYDDLVYEVYVVTEMFHNNDTFLIDVTVAKPIGDEFLIIKRIQDADEVSVTAEDGFTFTNTTREHAEVTLQAEKSISGQTPDENQKFTFELKNEAGEVVDTKTNNGSTVSFDTMTFEKSGVYKYTINEVVENNDAYIYDTSVYDVTITVTAPVNSDEKYQAVVTIEKNGEAYVGTPLFDNIKRKEAEVILKAEKTLDGKTPGKQDNFWFEIEDENGDVFDGADNNGRDVVFPAMIFDETGTYIYTIREIKENEFIIYDEAVYTAIITVTAPENSDAFEASVTYKKNGEDYDGIPLFANKTKPEETQPATEELTTKPTEATTEPEATTPNTTEPETTKATEAKETDSPQTGDSSNLMLWIVLLVLSGVVFTKIILPNKNRRAK